MNTFVGQGIQSEAATSANQLATQTIGTNVSKTVIGTQINLTATTINTLFGSQTQLRTTLTVTGLDSGARLTIPVTTTAHGSAFAIAGKNEANLAPILNSFKIALSMAENKKKLI